MKIAVVSFFALFSFTVHAQSSIKDLSFNDQALKKCVDDTAQSQHWSDVSQFTSLKCHGMNIKDAGDVTQLSHLQFLSLYNNDLSELDLRKLEQLQELNLAGNQLNQLHIAGLSNLTSLYLFKNKLTEVDLSGLSNVTTVRLMQNQLVKLDITPLKALQKGYFFDNQLADLQITGLLKLEFLDVRQNPMPDELYDFYDRQKGIVISHDGNADDWK